MKYLVSIILFLTLMSCKTHEVLVEKEVPIETVRVEYRTNIERDSIYIHDSIDRYVKGDTVYISSFKTKYRYITKQDTIFRHDSIEVPVTITKEIIKNSNTFDKVKEVLICIGFILLCFLGIKLISILK